MNPYSDIDIMSQIQSGDVEKLSILYERYKRLLFSYFYRMSGHAQISEDLVQNVFIRILRFNHQFKGTGSFKTWMYTIAWHEFADHARKNAPFAKMTEFSGIELPEEGTPETELDQKEEIELLRKAMGQLDDAYRQVLILAKYQEMRYREIAEILECSETAVKTKVFRAMNQLKKTMKRLEA
jgi:RNA polymerase sigma factor (sigma-70 family)